MPEQEDDTSQAQPDAGNSASGGGWIEYRDQQIRYDREYLERLKRSELDSPRTPEKPELPWGHPICDECPRRAGCGLQQAMRKVDALKAGGTR